MKPRSSTGIFACSIGMNSPLRWIMLCLRISGRLLEPQGKPVPRPLEEARGRDALERGHRVFPERLAPQRGGQRRDALPGREGRQEGLLADELRVQRVD